MSAKNARPTIGQVLRNEGRADDSWIVCPCGNAPDRDGFVACDAAGNRQADEGNFSSDDWDGVHLRCACCGVVFRRGDLVVIAAVEEQQQDVARQQGLARQQAKDRENHRKRLGEIIKHLRSTAGRTRGGIACQVQIPDATLVRIERGQHTLTRSQWERLCALPCMERLAVWVQQEGVKVELAEAPDPDTQPLDQGEQQGEAELALESPERSTPGEDGGTPEEDDGTPGVDGGGVEGGGA